MYKKNLIISCFILIFAFFLSACAPVSEQYFKRNFPDKKYPVSLKKKTINKNNQNMYIAKNKVNQKESAINDSKLNKIDNNPIKTIDNNQINISTETNNNLEKFYTLEKSSTNILRDEVCVENVNLNDYQNLENGVENLKKLDLSINEKYLEENIETDKKYIKILLKNFCKQTNDKENSLTLIPNGDYEIYVGKKMKGELLSGEEYKVGIYGGKRVVIAKQKVYDDSIYLKAKTGKEILEINGKKYRDNFYIQVINNKFRIINDVELENYLYGVVPEEMPRSWGIEALKAQAVVARTFALANLGKFKNDGYDLCNTVISQVYNGIQSEKPEVTEAINITKDEVVLYDNKMASVVYHSCCGGHTESIENVWGSSAEYLRGVSCPYCKNSPPFEWKTFISFSEITNALKKANYKVGEIQKVKVRRFSKSGRVKELTVFWSNGSLNIKGSQIRLLMLNKLRSTKFKINNKKDGIFLEGNGYGHGVGMCQFGAKTMAEKGFDYKKIIKFYFNDTEIDKWQTIVQTDKMNS